MARAASRRQVKPDPTPAVNLISKYGRVSKTQPVPGDDSTKKVFFIELPSSRPVTSAEVGTEIKIESSPERTLLPPTPSSSRKRKARSIEDDTSAGQTRINVPSPEILKRQRLCKDEPVPVKEELKPATTTPSPKNIPSTIADTRRKTRKPDVISQAKTEVRKANQKVKRSRKHNASTEPETKVEPTRKQLPVELLELLDLQRAILKTVSLQLVHQNNNAPLDISSITPHVARTWGKRRVTVDDIRTCIAIQDAKPAGREDEFLGSPFIVTDYGRGKLCLEMDLTKNASRIDEDQLCRQFEENLHIMCAQRATDEMSDLDLCFENLTFDDLPKSDITVRHTTISQNPVFAKGQRALNELKNGIVQKKQQKEAQIMATKFPKLNPDGTKMSLLDRLRAKEEANAHIQQPSGPELARKRALARVVDVAAIISMLVSSSNSAGQLVMSFTMAVLQQKLKDSVRVPMPMEEGIETVRILANEVAPEWLRVASVGGKEHVVIQTRRKPYDAELAARVSRLSA
ncbi:DNA mismatch repair protein msh-2 [Colletotrichum tofieldiae]|nr:DNA mismatch repair protein msh-2 [Colletotrichum tofieldiae]GKT68146.1 DNA mismatch repair protein msh-2 [Colletotrichum tofieldiae]